MTETSTQTTTDLETLARKIQAAADALAAVEQEWRNQRLHPDTYTHDNGYPFDKSLDEQVWDLQGWADGVQEDADIAAGRA